MARIYYGVLAAILVLGCPPNDKQKPATSGPGPCTKMGQSCEFSPGKLGTCVMKDGCADNRPECFVCQSQH